MNMPSGNKASNWKKIPPGGEYRAEAFLREREKLCVAACARFIRIEKSKDHVWCLDGKEGEISAILLHSSHSLFPVFGKNLNIPSPRFLKRFLGKVPVHALQGLRDDTALLEILLEDQGYFSSERIDYDLMSLDSAPKPRSLASGPEDLVICPAKPEDEEQLFALQAAYEQEEVLPENAVFNAMSCRLNLKSILSRQSVLVAKLGAKIVGKINTNLESFTRYQIGGVYIIPGYRSLGIGTKMIAVFAQELLAKGKALTLFVKKRNTAAIRIYRNAGFSSLADYRITYY